MKKLTMRAIKAFKVPPKSIAIWWLGQLSYIMKSPGGKIVAFDPYLTASCDAPPFDMVCKRNYPSPLTPEQLVGIDLYAVTHSHGDHLDHETLARYNRAGGAGPYLGPAESYEKFISLGVPASEVIMIWPNKEYALGDLTLRATFAVPYGGDDLTHVGYLVRVKGGPCVYLTGDTAYEEVLGLSIAPHKPDVLIACINDAFRNLGPANAARLVRDIKPKVAIPGHYDLMPDNMEYPRVFRTNLLTMNLEKRYRELERAAAYVYPER